MTGNAKADAIVDDSVKTYKTVKFEEEN